MADDKALRRILDFESKMVQYPVGGRAQKLATLWAYYRGFNLFETTNLQGTDQPIPLFPLQVNYARTVVDKLNSFLWGEWNASPNRHVVNIEVPSLAKGKEWGAGTWEPKAEQLSEALEHIFFVANDADDLFFRGGKDAGARGDAIYHVGWDVATEEVIIRLIPPPFFHCIWDSDGNITEAVVVQSITKDQARQEGWVEIPGWSRTHLRVSDYAELVERWEHWTPMSYSLFIEDQLILTKINPFVFTDKQGNILPGVVPFVHIPNRVGSDEFYGQADIDHVMLIQDEINRVLADQGDSINYHAHPLILRLNIKGETKELQVGPDRVWDVKGENADVRMLEWRGTPPAVQQYVEALGRAFHETSCVPTVAFGNATGSGQLSSLTLQVQLIPATQVADEKRLAWAKGTRELCQMALRLCTAKGRLAGQDFPVTLEEIRKHRFIINFAPMLPRDRTALINDNVALVGAGLRSPDKALREIGETEIEEEKALIEAWLKLKAKFMPQSQPNPQASPDADQQEASRNMRQSKQQSSNVGG